VGWFSSSLQLDDLPLILALLFAAPTRKPLECRSRRLLNSGTGLVEFANRFGGEMAQFKTVLSFKFGDDS
jgi:hypothetical protein